MKFCQNTKRVMAIVAVVTMIANVAIAVGRNEVKHVSSVDSVRTVIVNSRSEVNTFGRMYHSAFPVKMEVKGMRIKVQSECQQVLPIYTKRGDLFMNVQLTRGTNWLSGLPRGSYRINNRTINIG